MKFAKDMSGIVVTALVTGAVSLIGAGVYSKVSANFDDAGAIVYGMEAGRSNTNSTEDTRFFTLRVMNVRKNPVKDLAVMIEIPPSATIKEQAYSFNLGAPVEGVFAKPRPNVLTVSHVQVAPRDTLNFFYVIKDLGPSQISVKVSSENGAAEEVKFYEVDRWKQAFSLKQVLIMFAGTITAFAVLVCAFAWALWRWREATEKLPSSPAAP